MGFGEGDERSELNANNGRSSSYFRRPFDFPTIADQASDSRAPVALRLRLLAPSKVAVYINGRPVFTSPEQGEQAHSASDVAAATRAVYREYIVELPYKALRRASNMLAVQVQHVPSESTSLSFDASLSLAHSTPLARAPYIQQTTPASVKIRWATAVPATSVVRYASSVDDLRRGKYQEQVDTALTQEHNVQLTGLVPDTRYFYSVGTETEVLAGVHTQYFFTTHPESANAQENTRVWVLGDSGDYNVHSKAVKNAFLAQAARDDIAADVWLMLGDNAYYDGTLQQFDRGLFDLFPDVLRNLALWSALGNHDADAGHTAYYDLFSFPRHGQAGGVQSETEAYYSFDYRNIHFVSLDSVAHNESEAMQQWLIRDLLHAKQNRKTQWTIVFFHHAPYSKGTHDSDDPQEWQDRMRKMRWNFLPILDEQGVDLVLAGHSHVYERSYLLQGHYGQSSELDAEHMILDSTSGDPARQGAYKKHADKNKPNSGIVYVVAGSAAKKVGGHYYGLKHPVMVSLTQTQGEPLNGFDLYGSLMLDIQGNRVTGRFIDETGAIKDSFQLQKQPGLRNKSRYQQVSISGVSKLPIPMKLISHYTWEAVVHPAATAALRFEAAEHKNAKGVQFGDSNKDSYAEKGGAAIPLFEKTTPAKDTQYRVRFNTVSMRYSLSPRGKYSQNVNQLWYRAEGNDQAPQEMRLIDDYLWSIQIDTEAEETPRFTFSTTADGTLSYGDNNGDGLADSGGQVIALEKNRRYEIRVNELSMAYTVRAL